MDKTTKIIRDFYNNSVQKEWDRLDRHRIEFELTKRFLNRYIKEKDKVLDIGGGPGRYSLYLAERGCDVTLVDLSEANIDYALHKAEEQGLTLKAFVCDAREIERQTSKLYDHILLMGPLYHLLEEKDRINTVNSCLNLLKPGGIIFISFISSYAGIIYSMKYEPQLILNKEIEYQYKYFKDDKPFSGESFTQAFFIRQKDILPFMSQFGLEKLHLLGQESCLAPNEPNILCQPEEVVNKWLNLAEEVCEREDLLSFSEHLMYIGKKLKSSKK